jgi:hypothetical protein
MICGMEPFYRPSFQRHRHSLVVNGFYTRELDADDFAFLEYVKTTGSANGSLPNTGVVLLEELEFWHLPYSVAPDVERRIGSRPRPVESVERRELRQARSDAQRARRIIRENEQAIAAAELEREQREWQAAQERRKLRELLSDAEWDAAAPHEAPFGLTVRRHYVPQWKLDELRLKKSGVRLSNKAKAILRAKQQEAVELVQARQREKEQEAAEAAQARQREKERQAAETARRQQAIADARAIVERGRQLEREARERAVMSYRASDQLKQKILALTLQRPDHPWTREEMMGPLGCSDLALLNRCLEELVRDRRLLRREL